jgi:hypothetical protein
LLTLLHLPLSLQLDRQDAQERAEARRVQIERANKMLADDTDRVKNLHGRLLLAETMAENAALVAYKQSRKQLEGAQKAAFVQQQRQVGDEVTASRCSFIRRKAQQRQGCAVHA